MVVSRMRLFPFELEKKIRIVGLAACVANAKDLGDWIGATAHGVYLCVCVICVCIYIKRAQ